MSAPGRHRGRGWRVASLAVVVSLALPMAWARAAADGVRLAVVPAGSELAAAVDVLTAELSANAGLELVERAQIARIYREQALAAGADRFLRAGQLLGADGVLAAELASESGNSVLSVRLTAVRAGVVLRQRTYPWPLANVQEWATVAAVQFAPLFPKLSVPGKNAMPISVLNLRSAVRSRQTDRIESELTWMVQNRLTHERELFVLERRRLGWLSDEKDLSPRADDPFWSGSYLLEGSIDRQGFSPLSVTVQGRLVPPGGAAPMEFEVTGPRTNLMQVADLVVQRILEALRRPASRAEWRAADEAANYLQEAKWALKWNRFGEAQAAADAAWALGRRDLECALVRVQAYVALIPSDTGGGYQHGEYRNSSGRARATTEFVTQLLTNYPQRVVYRQRGTDVVYAWVGRRPDADAPARAAFCLGLYQDFSRHLPADQPEAGTPWSDLGIRLLESASQVLQHFHFVPDAQPAVAESLAELRAQSREVADWLARSRSARDSSWIGVGEPSRGDLSRLASQRNIFACTLDWGCFWQEGPEGGAAVYRELLSSPAYAGLNTRLWFRPVEQPRLAAWSDADRQRIPGVWAGLLADLERSTNFVQRIEGRMLALADAASVEAAAPAVEEVVGLIREHRGQIVSNAVDLLDADWHLGELIGNLGGSVSSPKKVQLQQRFRSEWRPEFQSIRDEHGRYARQLNLERVKPASFERQKKFLAEPAPFDPGLFFQTFRARSWSATQATELLQLLPAYRTNVLDTAGDPSGQTNGRQRLIAKQLGDLADHLHRVTLPATARTRPAGDPPSTNAAPTRTIPAATASRSIMAGPRPGPAGSSSFFQTDAEILEVSKFESYPMGRLTNGLPADVFMPGFFVLAHRWREARLWLDCRFDLASSFRGHCGYHAAFLVWDPQTGDWDMIPQTVGDPASRGAPAGFMGEPEIHLYFEVFRGAVYLSDGPDLRRFDLRSRRWEKLGYPGMQGAELFVVNGRLYAANADGIHELLDDGQGTRVLASTRRRPAASALDSLATLGGPTLFPGPNGAVRSRVGDWIHEWDGRDWWQLLALPSGRVQTFGDVTLLRALPYRGRSEVWIFPHNAREPELCWLEESSIFPFGPPGRLSMKGPAAPASDRAAAVWSAATGAAFAGSPAACSGTNLFFLVDHTALPKPAASVASATNELRHANLVCLDRRSPNPLVIPIRFAAGGGAWTTFRAQLDQGRSPHMATAWLVPTPEHLLIGQPMARGVWLVPWDQLAAAWQHRAPPAAR